MAKRIVKMSCRMIRALVRHGLINQSDVRKAVKDGLAYKKCIKVARKASKKRRR